MIASLVSDTNVGKAPSKSGGAVAFRTPARARVAPRGRARLLSALCEGLAPLSVKGILDRPISGLCADSRKARRGVLFFALPGNVTDGSLYIEEAIDRGAFAVVTERVRYWHPDVTFIQVDDVRETLAKVAARFHGHPATALDLVGVAGSMGKTSVVHLLQHLLGGGDSTGMIGTNRYLLGGRNLPSNRTTPEAIDLHEMLAEMRDSGCGRAVLEASSVGTAQGNLDGIPFRTLLFTNLGRDDARRHGGLEKCYSIVRSLFLGEKGPAPEVAAINLDDPWGRRLIQELPPEVRVVTFGESEYASLSVSEVESGADGLVMRLNWRDGSVKLRSPMLGRFQVTNLLAACAGAYAHGLDLNAVLPRAAGYRGTPGRMERIECEQPFTVIVDYAHTPETIQALLRAARETGFGRVLTVLGCGGGVNRSSRAFLVETAQEESDFVWATTDNPRMEPVEQIFADMRRGVTDAQRIVFVEGRDRAIASALETASVGDIVVIAGKGHQAFQDIGGRLHPFDDRENARELIANLTFPVS